MSISRLIEPMTGYTASMESPLNANTRLTVIVPVYNETIKRLNVLLGCLARQFVEPGTIEIIIIVNNKPNDNSLRWRQAYESNQAVLHLPWIKGGYPLRGGAMPVHAIDLSSENRCFRDNNVGLARRIGLHEAALRYRHAGRNGIILHTDADARYDDPQFVSKVLRIFDGDPRLVGLAGAHAPEVDADDPESSELAVHLKLYVNSRRYVKLAACIRRGKIQPDDMARKMLGFCMIHRAFEGVAAGGIDPIAFEEDLAFGRRLQHYADTHGMRLAHGQEWQNLGPIMALRASDRTPNSIRASFLDHVQDGVLYVDDVFKTGHKARLTDEYIDRLVAAVRTMPGGEDFVHFLFFESSLAHVRIK